MTVISSVRLVQMSHTAPTLPTILMAVVHDATFEIGCYGTTTDCLCRVTHPTARQEEVNDAYYPPVELGFFWLREHRGMWVASGMVNKLIFRDAETINRILNQIMAEALRLDEQLATCVELVEPINTSISNGEYDQFW